LHTAACTALAIGSREREPHLTVHKVLGTSVTFTIAITFAVIIPDADLNKELQLRRVLKKELCTMLGIHARGIESFLRQGLTG
jgi:hypothetical protein